MKIPLHNALDINDEENIDFFSPEENKSLIFSGCGLSGTDLFNHEEGLCIHCDYNRLQEEERMLNIDFLDRTEYWDFYDYWHQKKSR